MNSLYWYTIPTGVMSEFVDKTYLSLDFYATAYPAIIRDALIEDSGDGAKSL
ncbi:MAG: hypothetical protein ACKVQS_08495 [Fimbriimonadaceae bacterium]